MTNEPETRTVAAPDGTPIAFTARGAGANLVLVHGTGASRTRWGSLTARLENHFTVVAMDRRGRGDSGDAPDYAFEREFEDVAALVSSLPAPTLLFGHSSGAICALEAAMRTADRLAGLVLYEPPIFEGRDGVAGLTKRLEALLAAGDREGVVVTFMTDIVGAPPTDLDAYRAGRGWPDRLAAAHTLPRELRAVQDYRFDEARTAALDLPVLLLLGGRSRADFAAVIDRLERHLPDVRRVVMPGQSHIAMDTGPELVVDAINEFWREIG